MKKQKHLAGNSFATLPGELSVDWNKLDIFKQSLGMFQRLFRRWPKPDDLIEEHLHYGCCNPAVVVQTDPQVIVAAYSGDNDWALLLRFPQFFLENYPLKPGLKLLTVNTYAVTPRMAFDIENGPNATWNWSNFYPIIAEFCTSDYDTIKLKKREIEDEDWKRLAQLARQLISNPRLVPRNGSPYFSSQPQPLRKGYLT